MRKTSLFLSVILILGITNAFAQKKSSAKGSEKAVKKVEEMLEAIGGRENWASLKSLYIRAIHTEEGIDKPYQNEIWRNIDTAQFKIVQRNPDFHTVGIVNGDKGWIIRNKGEAKEMSEQQLAGLLHHNKHLLYGIFHRIAKDAPGLSFEIDEKERLVVFDGGKMLAAFEFNEKNLPYKFYTPTRDGKKENLSLFTQWDESEGFIHPEVSEPQGEQKTFFYAIEWKPGKTLLNMKFAPEKAETKEN